MVDRSTPRTKEEARNALNFKLWYPDRARSRSALVLRVSVDDGVKKNSTSYVIKQLVHAFSCALSSYGARGKFEIVKKKE